MLSPPPSAVKTSAVRKGESPKACHAWAWWWSVCFQRFTSTCRPREGYRARAELNAILWGRVSPAVLEIQNNGITVSRVVSKRVMTSP